MIPRKVTVNSYYLRRHNGANQEVPCLLVGFVNDSGHKGTLGVVLNGGDYEAIPLMNIRDADGAAFGFLEREFGGGPS